MEEQKQDEQKPLVKRSLIGLAKEHLGLPGETLPEFSAQYKKLTDKDKADLVEGFKALGFEATIATK